MTTLDLLNSVQFVVNQDGQPSAVQMSLTAWSSLLGWLEDLEDRAAIRAIAPKLQKGPRQSGALRWEEVRAAWNLPEAASAR